MVGLYFSRLAYYTYWDRFLRLGLFEKDSTDRLSSNVWTLYTDRTGFVTFLISQEGTGVTIYLRWNVYRFFRPGLLLGRLVPFFCAYFWRYNSGLAVPPRSRPGAYEKIYKSVIFSYSFCLFMALSVYLGAVRVLQMRDSSHLKVWLFYLSVPSAATLSCIFILFLIL